MGKEPKKVIVKTKTKCQINIWKMSTFLILKNEFFVLFCFHLLQSDFHDVAALSYMAAGTSYYYNLMRPLIIITFTESRLSICT